MKVAAPFFPILLSLPLLPSLLNPHGRTDNKQHVSPYQAMLLVSRVRKVSSEIQLGGWLDLGQQNCGLNESSLYKL